MVNTTDIYEAAYCKVHGFGIGKIYRAESGLAEIEIIGNGSMIADCIKDFYEGEGVNNAKLFIKEAGFIKYLVKERTN